MRSPHPFAFAALTFCVLLAACDDRDLSAHVVTDWNERIVDIARAEDKFFTLKGVRTASMMHLAMHDALNAIDHRYATYALETDARAADPIVAAAQAAHDVAVDQYPAARAQLDEELQKWLLVSVEGPAKRQGVVLGRAAAAATLAKRVNDGWNTEVVYQFHPMGPGVYAEFAEHSGTPQGFVFGAGWSAAKPFVLRSADQFRSLPPPAINSDAYTLAYDEVKEAGRYQSKSRTADQTHLAYWWKDFAENSHNRLARQLVRDEHTDLWVAARLFALMNVSLMDGYIAVFDSKYFYNYWRPFTAIRWAEHDGNPRTEPDLEWNNTHRHTYAHPSYPSAHGTACAAAMTIIGETYGDAHPFTMSTLEVDSSGPLSPPMKMEPPTRHFDTFSGAAMECALSRVYLGIHFRYDSEEGNRLGTRVGNHILNTFLKPLSPAADASRPIE
jgi:membrane-associated phospholipid phosphatase